MLGEYNDGQVFFYCRDNGARYAFVLGGESFAGIFLADMGKGCRGMRKSLCGVKWACWGKDWGQVVEKNRGVEETGE